MRVELPSGAWVELRENLKAADKFAVQDAIVLNFSDTKTQTLGAGVQNKMRNALLQRVITAWSYVGVPVPSQNHQGADSIGEVMDLDDYNALERAVEPLLAKVSFSPNREDSSSS
jgi:hypothetical protein